MFSLNCLSKIQAHCRPCIRWNAPLCPQFLHAERCVSAGGAQKEIGTVRQQLRKLLLTVFICKSGTKRERAREAYTVCARRGSFFSRAARRFFGSYHQMTTKKHDYYLIRWRVLWSCIARRPRLNNGARRDLKFTSAESPFWETASAERLRLSMCAERCISQNTQHKHIRRRHSG